MKKIILILSMLSITAFANPVNQMDVQRQINEISSALEGSQIHRRYYFTNTVLKTIRVRTRLEFGIEIPLIASFKLKPEVELYFSKK